MSAQSHQQRTVFWAMMIILLGLLLLLNNLDVIKIGKIIRDYWPVLIILLGVYLILKRERFSTDHGFGGDKDLICESTQAIYSNVFGDLRVSIRTANFESGKINNTFGDIVLDLEKLDITSGEKILDVHGVFGDVKISSNRELPVYIHASITAGDIKLFERKVDGFSKEMIHKSENYDTADKKLKIIVSQVFGDIKVW
ncbi:MAG TPA: hypothetical protein ENN22_12845 [bacterium]|nr:hypothetical protein [bacterium]